MDFSPANLLQQLAQWPVPHRYLVAFSGGCDSHVLLHALHDIRAQLPCQNIHVIHIDHGLQAESAQWRQHCAQVCAQLQLAFTAVRVDIERGNGQSLEAQARAARYQALREQMQHHDMLLTAHHQGDQAETLLLQLLRGAGVKGLAAMPALTDFTRGWLARPLLHYSRAQLTDYAQQQQLLWIDDPSNSDTRFDRNFLRQDVFPLLKTHWPGMETTLARAAGHQAQAAALLSSLAQLDWQQVRGEQQNCVRIDQLQSLDLARQYNVLRYWITEHCGLPCPEQQQLQRIITEVIAAAADANPELHWQGVCLRRYRGGLYLLADQTPLPDKNWSREWDYQTPLALPTQQTLQAQVTQGKGLRLLDLRQRQLQVRFRRGGEVCQPVGRGHHHSLKNLFQEWRVPPWQRARVPLIYIDNQLAQVVGYCLCEPFAGSENIETLNIYISP